MTAEGFVMVMQGKVVLRRGPSKQSRVHTKEWFLVSRLGHAGQMLLISWVGREADVISPRPVPRLTLVGLQQSVLRPGAAVRFDLLPGAPAGISIAGRMLPATGRALLSNVDSPYALRVVASLPNGLSCRIAAERRLWLGELIDDNRAG